VDRIRRATSADLDQLVELGRALHAEAPHYRDEPFEPEVLRAWLSQRLGGLLVDDNAVFVAERGGQFIGVLVALIVPRMFNRTRIACEMTLYVRPENRGGRPLLRLVAAYKQWARANGAHKAYMGVSTGIHSERTVRAYEGMGGKLDGHNVTMDL